MNYDWHLLKETQVSAEDSPEYVTAWCSLIEDGYVFGFGGKLDSNHTFDGLYRKTAGQSKEDFISEVYDATPTGDRGPAFVRMGEEQVLIRYVPEAEATRDFQETCDAIHERCNQLTEFAEDLLEKEETK